MDKERIRKRLTYWETQYDKLTAAYAALVEGRVKSYSMDDRTLTRFDISSLKRAIEDAEEKINEYEALLDGMKPRRAFGILPRDW